MSLGRSRTSAAVMVSAVVLAGLVVAESSGATTSEDTVAETIVAITSGTAAETSAETSSETAELEILPPDEPWDELTRDEWNARFWQRILSLPEDNHPWGNTPGERCGYGQSGSVFFLTGPADETTTCVVAAGTAMFVFVWGAECSTVEPPPFFGRTEEELRACARAYTDGGTDLEVRINGQDVADLDAYRATSPLFTITFPRDNLLGVEPGVAQAVSDDYSLIIAPPPPGEYEIVTSFRYDTDEFVSTVTLTVIVEAPEVIEPPTTA